MLRHESTDTMLAGPSHAFLNSIRQNGSSLKYRYLRSTFKFILKRDSNALTIHVE